MTITMTICQRYEAGERLYGSSLGLFHAAIKAERLPAATQSNYEAVSRGFAVDIGTWYYFPALEPALTFGRSARMSFDINSYGVYEVAVEHTWCDKHCVEEKVLLVGDIADDRHNSAHEVEVLKRFVQSVKENNWSSNWQEPTGFIKERTPRGDIVETPKKSLPL